MDEVGQVGASRLRQSDFDRRREAAAERAPGGRRRAAPIVLAAALLAAAAAAGIAIASFGGGSSTQTSRAPVAQQQSPPPASTAARSSSSSAKKSQSRRKASSSGKSSSRRTETAGRLAPAVSQPAKSATRSTRPVGSSGYALGGTHLFVRSGQTVTNFVVQAPCARDITIPAALPIRQNGTFEYDGIVRANPYTKANITGRFVGTTARLTMRFRALSCDSGVLNRTLRLS
jgi:hypothetical protein